MLRRFITLTVLSTAVAFAGNRVDVTIGDGGPRDRLDFNVGWRFARFGTMPDGSTKAEPANVQASTFDDASWRKLDLPHDWGIEGPFRKDLPNRTGKLPWAGIGWYRKVFDLAAADKGKQIFLDFDGAMSHATVYVNGKAAGEWPYGYASFRVDMTDHVTFGSRNVVAVRLDNPPDSSRWYPGGGIYRNTWLVKTGSAYFPWGGVFVTTPAVSSESATCRINYKLTNAEKATIESKVFFLGIGAKSNPTQVAAQSDTATGGKGSATITIKSPHLWSLESPNLYCVVSTLKVDGKVTDQEKTVFGIRTMKFVPKKGFLLNGKVVRFKGVCEHHDLGPLGSAFYTRAMERKLEILKKMGCNAIRTAHNMPAPELPALADRMGMLVMDEAFDCWVRGKTRNDYAKLFKKWHDRDLRAFVQRDRNHPCVVMWSTGNEVREQGKGSGHKISSSLTKIIKEEDPTRPVTAGCNMAGAGFNGFQKTVDVFGYNYKPHLYAKFMKSNPRIAVFGSETASCISSRGEYFFPVIDNKSKGFFNFQVSSYDLYAPGWASKPDIEFAGQDANPAVCGEFVWTGFDYIGEPTPYNKDKTNLLNFQDEKSKKEMQAMMARMGGKAPSRSSYFGILDLCGFKKDRFYIYQARWRPDLPMAHILPHWNWPERVGKVTPVHVYTSGDEAELFLNGKSLGRKKKGQRDYRLRWDNVKYTPGELKVVAYKAGKTWAHATMKTTGKATALKLAVDRNTIRSDGYDLSFVTVSVVDADGLVVPRSKQSVKLKLEGPGVIAAVGNGDPTNHESFQGTEHRVFNGLCLVVIRSKRGEPGELSLKVTSEGLNSSTVRITSK